MAKRGRGADNRTGWLLEQPTLTEVVRWYVATHVAVKKKTTASKYTWTLLDFAAKLPDHPTAADLLELLTGEVKAGKLNARTANMRRRVLNRCFECGRQRWPLLVNIAHNGDCPPLPEARLMPRGLLAPLETFPKLLAVMPDARARAFLSLQRKYGLRVGEARGVGLRNLKLDAGQLEVFQQRAADSSTASPLKYDTCSATMPLAADDVALLREVLRERMRASNTRSTCAQAFVFPYYRGEQDELMARCRAVSPADFPKVQVGIEGGAAWHVFRHTFGTEAVDRFAVHVTIVKGLMRHKHISSTQGYIASIRGGEFDGNALNALHAARYAEEEARAAAEFAAARERLAAERAAAAAELSKAVDVEHDGDRVSRLVPPFASKEPRL